MAFYLGKYCPGSGRDATYKPDEKDDSLGLPYRGAGERRERPTDSEVPAPTTLVIWPRIIF